MARRKTVNRKQESSLARVILGVVIVGGAILGVLRFSEWFNTEYIGGGVEASAETNLDQARRYIDEDNTLEAREILRPILARVKNPGIVPKALMLQAELDLKAGDLDAALEHLRTATEDYPESPHQPVAAIAYAGLLEENGRLDQALGLYEQVRDNAPPALRAPALSGIARHQERKGDILLAADLYRQAVTGAPWDSPAWNQAAEELGRLNAQLIFSSAKTPQSKTYRIAAGDSLTNVGIKLNTTQGLLTRANDIADPNRLHLGQTLKYTPKDFRIVIERSTCRLFLMDDEGLFKVYPLGLGKPGHDTALGKYKIGNKEKDPTWFKPGSKPIPPGDPTNELGTRWMPMVPMAEYLPTDLGIHGTIEPGTIGQYMSKGCPRLLKEDVEELYDLVVRSTPVTVVDVFSPQESPRT